MRKLLIRDYPMDDGRVVRVEVYYAKGGINYWNYKTDPRGYWLSMQPMRIEVGGGFTTSHYTPTEGYRCFMQEAKRFSASGLSAAKAMAEQLLEADGAVRDCLERLRGRTEEVVAGLPIMRMRRGSVRGCHG